MIKMGNLWFLFFFIKINVSLESFHSEKEIWKKSKYSPRKWDDRFPPEVKVYFWLTANWCECSHPERFSRERLFMREPPYLLFPEAFYVRLCYIFVVRARFSKLWLWYGNPQAGKCPWANSKKRKKRKIQKTRKAWQRKHVVASLPQTKVHIIGNGRQNLPVTRKVSERAGKISLEQKKEGYWMFGLILIAIVTVNRQTIYFVKKSLWVS